MRLRVSANVASPRGARWALWFATLPLLLTACRTIHGPALIIDPEPEEVPPVVVRDGKLDPVVGEPIPTIPHVPVEPVANEGLPIPITNATPWAPPGMAGPWPHDEYLLDGGDREVQANMGPAGQVQGLEQEDTVAIYDTIDGNTVIKPSNRVCLYAPRFAAVRKVTSVVQNEQRDQLIGVQLPVKPNLHREDQLATTVLQPIRPDAHISRKHASTERVAEGVKPAISRQPIEGVASGLATYENLRLIREGIFEESEKAWLIEAVDAAIVWTADQAVQVVLDGRAAVSVSSDQKVQQTFRVDVPNNPCLRVIKIASTKTAKPGDIVDFTIRFDNIGDQAIKNVRLIDNLTTRLEYVPGTAQSSRPADFSTEVNEGESLVLCWDFTEPLGAGQGGLVRFHCKVR